MFENNAMESIQTLENMIDLLIESEEVEKSVSFGGCVSHRVNHPNHGSLILIESPNSSECLVLKV